MAAPSPPSPPRGQGTGIAPLPPPLDSGVNNHINANNASFSLNQEGASNRKPAKPDLRNPDANIFDADGDGDEDDMPRPRPQPVKRDVDLNLILSQPQLSDFVKLSSEIQDKVLEHITKATKFLDHPAAQAGRVEIWDFSPAVEKAKAEQAARLAAQELEKRNTPLNSSGKAQDGEAEQAKLSPVIRIDVNTVQSHVSSMNVLKDEAATYFNKWKTTLSKRFSDVVVTNQPHFGAGPPRQGQGTPRGGAMTGGRPQQQVNIGNAYQADLNLIRRFPPVETPLCKLPVDKRRLLVHVMILMLLSTEHYISFHRIYLLYLASSLHLPQSVLIEEENRIARGLGKIYKTLCEEAEVRELEEKKLAEKLAAGSENLEHAIEGADGKKTEATSREISREKMENDAARKARLVREAQKARGVQAAQEAQQAQEAKNRESRRKWRPNPNPVQVGNSLLDVGIGIIEANQGLPSLSLAPITVAHLIGPLGDCELACGVFFGVNLARPSFRSLEAQMAGVQDGAIVALHCADGILKEIRDPKETAVEDRRMRLVVCINGLLTSEDDLAKPWACLGHHNEIMAVRWETEALVKVGNSLKILARSQAWPETKKALSGVPISTIINFQQWPESLMRVSKIVDNPYYMAYSKSTKVSEAVANCIVSHVLGERGITLIAHGIGCRVILLTLMCLAERKMYGMVDAVVMMGAPVVCDAASISVVKSVVSGRFVNVYSPNDYMLAFAARSVVWGAGLAGCQQIQGVGGVENHDVSDILDTHLDYPALVPTILKRIGWEDLKPDLRPLPMQPKIPASAAQKAPAAAGRGRPPQGAAQAPNRLSATTEKKENTLLQRGAPNSRGGGRGGGRGRGRGGATNGNDRRLNDSMGKMNL
ncbi:unnamed protein product [Discula destructiva]